MCNARYFYWFANLDSYLSHTRIPPYFFYFLETLGLSRNFRIFYEFITPLYIIKNGLITLWIKISFYKTLRILNITCIKINFSTFHIFLRICYFCEYQKGTTMATCYIILSSHWKKHYDRWVWRWYRVPNAEGWMLKRFCQHTLRQPGRKLLFH